MIRTVEFLQASDGLFIGFLNEVIVILPFDVNGELVRG
jgi:hypothetical protein